MLRIIVLLFPLLNIFSNKVFAYQSEWYILNLPDEVNVIDNDNSEINWIGIKNGHFILKKSEKRIRFFGTTVGWSYPNASHNAIDRSTKYMKSLGINCVRIHYPGLWNKDKKDFNPSYIKKLDYLTYSLSKHKIYYIIYSLNMLYLNYKGSDGFSFNEIKGATLMDTIYMNGIKVFWDSLMNHRNTYNGVKYKNDSALALIILTNENSVDKVLTMRNGKKLLKKYWERGRGKYGFNDIKFPNDKNCGSYKYLLEFAAKEDSNYYMEMKNFLIKLGVKIPVTFTNNPYSYYTQKTLSKIVDFIGVHTYGRYAGGYSSKFLRSSSPLVFNKNIPAEFPTRMLSVNYQNKPVIVDEWNIGYPSIYRLESTILIPTLSSYYDYDGNFYFSMFQHQNYMENPHEKQKYYLTSLESPYSLQVLFFPIISYAIKKGYIPINPDSSILYINDTNNKIDGKFQYGYSPLTGKNKLLYYIKRVIIKFSDKSNLQKIKVKIPEKGIIKNKNLFWDYKNGIFSFVSDRYFAYAGKGKSKFKFKGFEINTKNSRLCLAMVPLDRQPFKYSDKIILVVGENSYHNGDKKIIKQSFGDKCLTYYPGKAEQMSVERIPASIRIKNVKSLISVPYKENGEMALYALYPNGEEKFISNILSKKGNLWFNIDTGKYKTCYYLLEKVK